MAYITSEEVKAIRQAIKKEFPSYKWSITGANYSTINICLMSADFEVEEKYQSRQIIRPSVFKNEKLKEVFEKVEKIMFSIKEYYNDSDSMRDYFNIAYYYYYSAGRYDKPYVQK